MEKPRGILVAGNWKMNHGPKEAEGFFSRLKELSASGLRTEELSVLKQNRVRACLIPPYIDLERVLALRSQIPFPIAVAAQNAHWEKKGAYTGEVSGPMLQEIGVDWVLVGHSERRQYFGETSETVRLRAKSLLEQGFHVILCIGETRQERESGATLEVLARQLTESLPIADLDAAKVVQSRLILAYEPVWAIGTGLTATPEQAEEAHQLIRQFVASRFNEEISQKIAILYGGSVTPENMDSLLRCANIDGALVGGASLKPESFLALLQAGAKTS